MSRILRTRPFWMQLLFPLIALLSFFFASAQNPIVTENALPGNPSSEWQISGAGDLLYKALQQI